MKTVGYADYPGMGRIHTVGCLQTQLHSFFVSGSHKRNQRRCQHRAGNAVGIHLLGIEVIVDLCGYGGGQSYSQTVAV